MTTKWLPSANFVLSITFDDHQQPSVWTPLGDFFGTAPGKNLYRSLPTGVTEDGSYAYWYMPFAKRATIELKNDGSVDRTIRFEIVHAPLARSFAGLGHFCARWHRDLAPLPEDRFPDWRMLQATGRGRFCGVMLHVWNPKGGWWGEGDEKFFVDGENVSVHDWHGIGGLLRLRLVSSGTVPICLPLARR